MSRVSDPSIPSEADAARFQKRAPAPPNRACRPRLSLRSGHWLYLVHAGALANLPVQKESCKRGAAHLQLNQGSQFGVASGK